MEQVENNIHRAISVVHSPLFNLFRSKSHTILISAVIQTLFIDKAKTSATEEEVFKIIRRLKRELSAHLLEELNTKKTETELLDYWCSDFNFFKKVKRNENYTVELTTNGYQLTSFLKSLEDQSLITLDSGLVENLVGKINELDHLLTSDPKELLRNYKEEIKKLKAKILQIERGGTIQLLTEQKIRKKVSDILHSSYEVGRLLAQAGEEFYEHSMTLRKNYEKKLEEESIDAIEEVRSALKKHENFLSGKIGKAYQSFNNSLIRKNTLQNLSVRVKRIASNKQTLSALKESASINELKLLTQNIFELNGRIFKRKKDLNSSLSNFFENVVNTDYLRKLKLIKLIEQKLSTRRDCPPFQTAYYRKSHSFFHRNFYLEEEDIPISEYEENDIILTESKSVLKKIDKERIHKLVLRLPVEISLKNLLQELEPLSSSELVYCQSFFTPLSIEKNFFTKKMDDTLWAFQDLKLQKRSKS